LVAALLLSTALLATSSASIATATETADGTAPYAERYPQGPVGSITDTRRHTRDVDLSLLLWLPYYYGFGFGGQVRLEIPVLPDGFIPAINDEFSLEPSFGMAWTDYNYVDSRYDFVDFTPALYALWRFHFSTQFSAYACLGLGINIGVANRPYAGFYPTYFYWDPGVGISYKFTPGVALRAEIGAQGLKGGFSFYF
jgi:hypothetical protein